MKKIKEFKESKKTIREYLLNDDEFTLTPEEANTLRQAYTIGGMEFSPRIIVTEIPPRVPTLPNLYAIDFKCNQSDKAVTMFPIFAANIDELLKIYMEILHEEINL